MFHLSTIKYTIACGHFVTLDYAHTASEPEWSNQEASYKKYAKKISYPDNIVR